MTEAPERPWKGKLRVNELGNLEDENGHLVARCAGPENAQAIVDAVNEAAGLRELLSKARESVRRDACAASVEGLDGCAALLRETGAAIDAALGGGNG